MMATIQSNEHLNFREVLCNNSNGERERSFAIEISNLCILLKLVYLKLKHTLYLPRDRSLFMPQVGTEEKCLFG